MIAFVPHLVSFFGNMQAVFAVINYPDFLIPTINA